MTDKYCSIDLEFTGFDPEKEQILEIGFAFFELSEDGLKVGETWSQVFQPTVEVHPKILGLTGISQQEIEEAPAIEDYKDFLSEKLSDVIVVAHNPTLDIKFLEMAGVKLSGRSIDSLELVQFLLPTHHSYNLENLMHHFGIVHKDSHRALGDCLATISLVEKMITIHSSFDEELKTKLAEVYNKANFEWTKLLQLNLSGSAPLPNQNKVISADSFPKIENFNQDVILDNNLSDRLQRLAVTANSQDGQWLITTQSKRDVISLWQQGLADGVFQSEDLFNQASFDKFLASAQTSEELRFCLKILVWLHTNWQVKTILDLNLSFFGGQFKSFIIGSDYFPTTHKVIACDYETLQTITDQDFVSDYNLIIVDMQRYEKFLTTGSKDKLSWSRFQYILKTIYNPETEIGEDRFKNEVIDSLAQVDLFFGLVQIILRQQAKELDYVSMEQLEVYQSIYYKRLVSAAQNLSAKLGDLATTANSPRLKHLSEELYNYFITQENVVKWVELTEENAYLHAQLINIEYLAREITNNFASVKYTDCLINKNLLFYLSDRLGFNTEHLESSNNFTNMISSTLPDDKALLDQVKALEAPAVVIFSNVTKLKQFYKEHFVELKKQFHIFAQDYSGSGNKIFRNFKIFDNALMLATSGFINKQKYSVQTKQILFIESPKLDTNHPYYSALLTHYVDKYENLEELLIQSELLFNLKQLSEKFLPMVIAPEQVAVKFE
jgi:DNA polymerase III epsilon subunit-like protein